MMDLLLIVIVAGGASMLTFFSGFGLGTLLLPVFLLFFPVDIAIAMTAIVHFLNNIFKTGLIGSHTNFKFVAIFGIPAFFCAFIGARTLNYLANFPVHYQFKFLGTPLATTPVQVIIGLLLLIFAVVEILPSKKRSQPSSTSLIFGGAISGFFGGLSGHQGALRSAFLIRLGLSKEAFVATGIIISLFIDMSRLSVYWTHFPLAEIDQNKWMLLVAVLAAFSGAIIGRRLLKKVTIRVLQYFVAAGIFIVGILLILGVV